MRAAAALLAVGLLAGCAAAADDLERTAPDQRTTPAGAPRLDVERISLQGTTGPADPVVTTSAPTTTAPTTTSATAIAPPATTTATRAPAPATVAVVAPAPVPAAPRTTAPPTRPATIAPAPAPVERATTAPAPTSAAPTTAPPTTARPSTTTAVTTTTTTLLSTAGSPPVTAGFDGRVIRVGVLTTTTNPVWGQLGKAILAGVEARVAAINRRGGIGGRYRVELVVADTNYDPSVTASQLDALKDRVVGFASILGTPSVEAVEPTLRQLQMLAGAASQEARWANAPNLLPVFNSYQVQAINGIAYFLETSGRPDATICALTVATSYGEAGVEGVRFARSQMGFVLGPMEAVAATSTNVTANISALKAAGCQAVVLVTTPQQTLAAVLTGRALAYSPRWIIMGASFSDRLVTPQTGPLFEQGAWVVGDGTQWGDANVPGMKQLADELIASDNRYWTENPDVGLTFGWAQARVLEATLERAAERHDLSHAGLVAASKEIGIVDLAGLGSTIDYSSAARLANGRTTVFAVDGSYRNAIRAVAPGYSTAAARAYRPAA